MDKKQLDERLQQLHDELQQIETVDEGNRSLLQKLQVDIRELLDSQEEDQRQHYKRFSERLGEAAIRFEASHPNLTLMMGQLAEVLANLGI